VAAFDPLENEKKSKLAYMTGGLGVLFIVGREVQTHSALLRVKCATYLLALQAKKKRARSMA